jgi:hypothetical protein
VVTRRHRRDRRRVVVGQVVAVVVQLGRHRLAQGLAAVALVGLVRVHVGVWLAALLGGVAMTVGFVVGLAALDSRPEGRARPVGRGHRAPGVEPGGRVGVVEVVPGPASGAPHVDFARGLAGLAGWYLDECEREASR